jgi:hypothetical protein
MRAILLTIMYRATYMWPGVSFPMSMEACTRPDELSSVYTLVYMLHPLKLKK